MAFQRKKFDNFYNLLRKIKNATHPEEQAVTENFILEECLSNEREDSYANFLTSPQDLDSWNSDHENYVSDKIQLLKGLPETFTNINTRNLLPDIEQEQYLLRLENLAALEKIARDDNDTIPLIDFITRYLRDSKDQEALHVIQDFLTKCNRYRDLRPIFVGFWGEVRDLLEPNDDDWANKLRDRFGLGHLDPYNENGEDIPVLLFRYRVKEVVNTAPKGRNFAAIPTVLDSALGPFFCPTPRNQTLGQTLDLTPGDDNEYELNCEILHRYIAYQPSHIHRVGWITKSPGKTCEKARRIHLEYWGDEFEYFDQL